MARSGRVRVLSDACLECPCEKYVAAAGESVTISDELIALAHWQIKQHKRMIHEIRQKFGIQER